MIVKWLLIFIAVIFFIALFFIWFIQLISVWLAELGLKFWGTKNDKGIVVKERKNEMVGVDLTYKNLIRIPVWALYSLIVATVVMSIVMLINIWFPDSINAALIWKMALSYGIFLVSALVISNLTDRIKQMRKFETES